jgi:hypothetical protein
VKKRNSAFPPDFLILGGQKCGTTSMASALREHPEIFVPRTKEATHFGFVNDDEVGGSHYQSFFSGWSGQPVVGEATPEYLVTPRSAEQICRFLPEVKAIVQLRNPIDRAYSAYWHGERAGWLSGGFKKAVDAEFASSHSDTRPFHDLIRRGQYSEQLQWYFDQGFDRDQMLVLLFDDILTDTSGALRTVQEFLEVEVVLTDFPRANTARVSRLPRRLRSYLFRHWRKRTVRAISVVTQRPFVPPPMDPEVRETLVAYYRPWNNELSELLGRDLSFWNQ